MTSFPAKKAGLFNATQRPLPDIAIQIVEAQRADIAKGRTRLALDRANVRSRSQVAAASSGVGQILEMLTASLPQLPISTADCRPLLKPIDYIEFAGASKGNIKSIRFIEAKTGRQRLSPIQKSIKLAVEAGKVTLRVAQHQMPAFSE